MPTMLCRTQLGTIISDLHTGIKKLNLYFLWKRYKCGYFKYIVIFFFVSKGYSNHYLPIPPSKKEKKKKFTYPVCFSNFKKVQKISKFSYYCTYMQRRKHIQLDLRVSFIPCRAKDYCEKRHRYRKKRRAAITNQTGQGSRSRKEFRSNMLKKKKLLELSFDFLFPDSPYDSFCHENFHGRKKKINNLGIKKSAGWMPFTARLTFEKVSVMH